MSAKGSILSHPERKRFLTKKTYDDFIAATGSRMSYEQWRLTIKTFNTGWRGAALGNALGCELPQGMGVIAVDKYKPKHIRLNHRLTKQLGKPVPYLNLHTFGYAFSIKWFKHRIVNFKFHQIFRFDGNKDMDTELSKILFSGDFPYENLKPATFRERMRLKKYLDKNYGRDNP